MDVSVLFNSPTRGVAAMASQLTRWWCCCCCSGGVLVVMWWCGVVFLLMICQDAVVLWCHVVHFDLDTGEMTLPTQLWCRHEPHFELKFPSVDVDRTAVRCNPDIIWFPTSRCCCNYGIVGVVVAMRWWCPGDDLSVIAMLQRLQCRRWRDGGATTATNLAAMTRLQCSHRGTLSELLFSLPSLLFSSGGLATEPRHKCVI
jgi:hypothetical protein